MTSVDEFADKIRKREERMITRALGVAVIGMGMAGLHYNIEYSGWVLFIGILMVL